MEILDPFAHELLVHPPPPVFDFSPGDGTGRSMDIAQLDDCIRAVGVLPPLPTAAAHVVDAHVQPAAHSAASSQDEYSAAALDACYDSDIDASLRATETNARDPSPGYLDPARGGGILGPAATRAALVAWMFGFAWSSGIGPAALHRAVSYADRLLSAGAVITISADDIDYRLRLLGAAAVYAAAKQEDSSTPRRVNARDIAARCGFAAGREVVAAERAALGYRLGGPTAHTFVEHFTRHTGGGVGGPGAAARGARDRRFVAGRPPLPAAPAVGRRCGGDPAGEDVAGAGARPGAGAEVGRGA
jgi:cyclin A